MTKANKGLIKDLLMERYFTSHIVTFFFSLFAKPNHTLIWLQPASTTEPVWALSQTLCQRGINIRVEMIYLNTIEQFFEQMNEDNTL